MKSKYRLCFFATPSLVPSLPSPPISLLSSRVLAWNGTLVCAINIALLVPTAPSALSFSLSLSRTDRHHTRESLQVSKRGHCTPPPLPLLDMAVWRNEVRGANHTPCSFLRKLPAEGTADLGSAAPSSASSHSHTHHLSQRLSSSVPQEEKM